MLKKFHFALLGISVLSMLAVLPAMAETITERYVVNEDENITLSGLNASNIVATENGGAIYNAGVLTLGGNSAFIGDQAAKGGAIYNAGTLTINDSSFTGNIGTDNAGAIANSDETASLTLNNVNFTENDADWGGAIIARGIVNITGGSFTGNTSNDGGGAIYLATLANKGHKLSIDGTTFTNNSTAGVDVDGGGAIGSFSDLILKNSVFIGNHVDGTSSHGGGALFLGSVSTNDIQNVTFNSNTSATNGGAISMRYVDVGDNSEATVDITGSTFTGNTAADGFGGAIYNTFHNDKNNHGYAYVGSSEFNGNSALSGGAVYNETSGTKDSVGGVMLIESSTFTSNVATENGGAIYNAGVLTLGGTNVFTGNIAGNLANDIYNAGTLMFAEDSVTTMDGGVNGDGTMCIDTGATLNLGTASIVQSGLTLDGTLNAVLKNADEFASFNITSSFDGDGILNLDLRGAGEYAVFQGEIFNNENVTVSSTVFDYDWNDDFDTITVTLKSVEDIASENGLSGDSAQTVANLVSSSSEKLNEFADVVQNSLANGDTGAVEQAHKAIHPETESVVQSVSTSVQNAIANLAAGRMAGLMGRSGGAMPARNGVWVEGMYNKSKQNDAFNGYTRGIVAGVDTQIARGLMLGAGYSYAHSDISAIARNTEIDSNTIFIYGQYKPTAWYMNAMANYTMSDYSEKSDVLGVAISSDFDVDALGAAVMTGYDFAGGITPELGLRYMHISADEYKNSLGVKSKLGDSDYLTAVLGTKYAFDYRIARGFTLRPELRYAVKWDIVSDKSVATITMPGVNSYVLDGNRLSRIGAEFGGGLVMKYGDLSLALNYDIEVREGYTSQTGRVRARMLF